MIEIKSSERKDNRKGPWLVLTYINDKGEEKTTNVFDKKIIEDQFKGPGKYEAQWVQNGKYWNLSGLSLVAATCAASSTLSGNGNGYVPAAGAQVVAHPKTDALGAKVDIAQAAIAAAGAIVAAELQSGLWAADEGNHAFVTMVMDHATFLSRALMSEARNFAAGNANVNAAGTYIDDAGRRHEPVGA